MILDSVINLKKIVEEMGYDNDRKETFYAPCEKLLASSEYDVNRLESLSDKAWNETVGTYVKVEDVPILSKPGYMPGESIAIQLVTGDANINDVLVTKVSEYKYLSDFLDAVFGD